MRKTLLATVIFLFSYLPALGQSGVAVSIYNGPTAPSTCRPTGRNVFVDNDAVPAVLKLCTAADTWSDLLTSVSVAASYLKLDASNDPLTGALTGVAGTAALPSFSFTGEADTGMFLSAANAVGFATGGTERWVINSSGAFNCATDGGCDIGNGAADPRDLSLKRNLILRGSTSGKVTFAAAATTTDYTFTWPSAASGSPGTLFLRDDGAWAAAGISGLGSTDNAVPRTVGTGGATLEGTTVLITDTNGITVPGSIIGSGTANRIGTATTADALADTLFATSATTQKGVVAQGKASQTESLFEAQLSSGVAMWKVKTDATDGGYSQWFTAAGAGYALLYPTIGWRMRNTIAYCWSSGDAVSTSADTCISRPTAGVTQFQGATLNTTAGAVRIVADANGATRTSNSATELLTLSTGGATTNTSGNIAPANSDIEAILARVTTTITTATDWSVAVTAGIASCTNAWVAIGTTTTAQTGLTAGTTVIFKPAAGLQCHVGTATTLTVTTTGTPGAGAIRLTPVVKNYVAPTS